jgi:hypothetical protein
VGKEMKDPDVQNLPTTLLQDYSSPCLVSRQDPSAQERSRKIRSKAERMLSRRVSNEKRLQHNSQNFQKQMTQRRESIERKKEKRRQEEEARLAKIKSKTDSPGRFPHGK